MPANHEQDDPEESLATIASIRSGLAIQREAIVVPRPVAIPANLPARQKSSLNSRDPQAVISTDRFQIPFSPGHGSDQQRSISAPPAAIRHDLARALWLLFRASPRRGRARKNLRFGQPEMKSHPCATSRRSASPIIPRAAKAGDRLALDLARHKRVPVVPPCLTAGRRPTH